MSTELERYVGQLAKAHGFTLAELEANRTGVLHEAQVTRAKRGAVTGGFIAFVLGDLCLAAGLVGAMLFHDGLRPPISSVDLNAVYGIAGAGIVVALTLWAVAVVSFRKGARRKRAYLGGGPTTFEGPALKSSIEGRRGASTWNLTFGGQTFQVSRATWELVTHGAKYRAYVMHGELLSFEPVSHAA